MADERILVVDDDEDMLSTCRKFLDRQGYDVATTDRGQNALAMFDEAPFDLVLTDLKMPEMDGMELLRELRRRAADAIVIVFTGFGTIEDAVTAMKAGAFDFLTKPFTPDHLSVSVSRALKQRQLYFVLRSLLAEATPEAPTIATCSPATMCWSIDFSAGCPCI